MRHPRWQPTVLGALMVCLLAASPAPAQSNLESIRVAVVRDNPQVDLHIHGRFTVRTLENDYPLQQRRQLRVEAVRALPEGIALGEEVLPVVGVRIEPERDAAISLNGTRLRGTIDIIRKPDLTLLVINHVALEDYLKGVLSKEAPDYWPEEALKAIAIAARTYALYQRLTKAQLEYDVTGDVMSQDYGGKTAEKVATTRAVDATAGLIVTDGGKLFPTFYHSTCGGVTEQGRTMGDYNLRPLQGGVLCHFCADSPFYAWRRRITKADLAWALRKNEHQGVGTVKELRVTKRTPYGRVEQIAIIGSQRTLLLSGYDLRALFGFEHIRSAFFTVTPVGESFVLDGHGWGHGVGLCQWGTAELARRGVLAPEILAFYYPGATLASVRELADVAPTSLPPLPDQHGTRGGS